ncbi:hypothetical protein, partial [Nostoc sp.]
FSQIWEKGSQNFKVPLPYLGEGFRVRAKTTVLNLDEVYLSTRKKNEPRTPAEDKLRAASPWRSLS